ALARNCGLSRGAGGTSVAHPPAFTRCAHRRTLQEGDMSQTTRNKPGLRRPPQGKTIAEVMTPNPVSLRADATLEEAVTFLVETGYSAAPVIDDAGRPVGVISRTDIVVYDRERLALPSAALHYFESADLIAGAVRETE